MSRMGRESLRILVAAAIVVGLTVPAAARRPAQSSGPLPANLVPVWRAIHHSYMWIFKNAGHEHFSQAQYKAMSNYLQNSRNHCINHFKDDAKKNNQTISSTEKYLQKNTAHIGKSKRHTLHCRIQNARGERAKESVMAGHALPIAYANYQAKLKLMQNWAAERAKLESEIKAGTYKDAPWGNVQDIGNRVIAPGQSKDIKMGKEATQQLFSQHVLPPLVKDKKLVNYVKSVADRVAAHSDLHIPLHVYLLDSKTINAFSIGGGYLFVYRGLLGAVKDEDELAGVMGHEIAHIVCRHSHKKMKGAEIANILMTAAEMAGVVFTGGASSIGAYYAEQYALQYGFEGLGLLVNLKLLGVSRKYELQADHLGIQYAWNSGYDPDGFVRFFSWMANKEGYVNSLDWFYDHPPFYKRMVKSEEEILYLPKRPNEVITTSAFIKMKKELARYVANRKEASPPIPKNLVLEPGCGAPPKHHYKIPYMIETLCGTSKDPGKLN